MIPEESPPDFAQIQTQVQALAQTYADDLEHLLALLRLLEQLHREIRDTTFQAALPKNRQALYKLLRTIEQDRGWPYIPVMPLAELCRHLESDLAATTVELDQAPENPQES